MFVDNLLSNPSRDVGNDKSSPAVRESENTDICYERFRQILNRETSEYGQGHRKRSTIYICPLCQCQTDLIVKPQRGRQSWRIRIALILTRVLSCFAFRPLLIDDLKQFEYKYVRRNITIYSFKRYD